tara:strand:+ start:420 stop:2048 length:1629 start_codon:yes stop_codon:yes gene_type:complete
MKKIFYSFAILSLLFTSCNPLEDIYDEIDAKTAINGIIGDVERTLSDDDYADLDLSFGNFSSVDDAKLMLPSFITSQYPALGVTFKDDGSINEASSALITYKLFSPIKFEEYTLVGADYAALELTSLNNSGEYNDFFDQKFPSEVKGTVIDLTFKTEPTISNYTLTNDDYDLVGSGRFDNFDIRDGRDDALIEARRVKIQTILLNNFPEAAFGVKYNVTYKAYDGSSTEEYNLEVQLEENPTDPSKTTTYTLVNADYQLIGNGNFNNFDIRDGKPEADVQVRRAKIETILLNNYPSAVSGDFFVISYDTYDGVGRPVLEMILQFDGTNYNIFDVKVYALYTFTLEDTTMRFTLVDDWAAPISFTSEEYELMGGSGRFSNFSGETSEANRKIAIYLETLYPFAANEDFVAVQYNFYSGSTSIKNVNFVFDGTVWNSISSVIDTELKFGHDGSSWVPDNTIKYTLINADFALVDNGRYNNFDVREGKDEETVASRLVKLNIILKANFPASAQGQKFSVTYAVYDGANGFRTTNVILEGADYILQ